MKAIIPAAGWVLFAVLVGNFFMNHGSQWTTGRYGMPRSLVAEDGMHYQDGSAIDPVTLAAIKADMEEEVYLGLVSAIGLLLVVCASQIRKVYRMRILMEERRLRERYGPRG